MPLQVFQVLVVAAAVAQERALRVVRRRVLDQRHLVVERLAAVGAPERIHSVVAGRRLARRRVLAQRRPAREQAAALFAHEPVGVDAR